MSNEESFFAREPESVEGVAIGQEEVKAGVGAVIPDPSDGLPDAGNRVPGLPDVIVQESEVPLGVGVAEEEAKRPGKVFQTVDGTVVAEDEALFRDLWED